jgi:hypothetical protein
LAQENGDRSSLSPADKKERLKRAGDEACTGIELGITPDDALKGSGSRQESDGAGGIVSAMGFATVDYARLVSEPDSAQIVAAARAFVASAFPVLTDLRVIPTPRYHPFIRVGRDYSGQPLMELPEFKTLENLLDLVYPNRFSGPLHREHPEFANQYILSFLEACVRRCADQDSFAVDAYGVGESISEFIEILNAPSHTVAVVRAMSHVTTSTGAALALDGIDVVPESCRDDYDFFVSQCRAHIPGAGGSFNRQRPSVFGHPHAVLASTATTEDSDMFDATAAISRRLDRFILILRLLTGTTAVAHFEVRGPTTLVGASHPEFVRFQPNMAWPMVRRTARLNSQDARPIAELGALLDSTEFRRHQMAAASFDVALGRFNASFAADPVRGIVDLATALEAVLVDEPDGTEGITVRLRTRSAGLLATNDDPPAKIFNDVGAFYDLRSTFVHGGNLSEKRLRSKILGISTLTERSALGIAAAQALDRMRDIARRAILARLCLATGPEPIWPFNPKTSLEVAFADDARRRQMRDHWHGTVAGIGADWSSAHLAAPSDILREDYGRATEPVGS